METIYYFSTIIIIFQQLLYVLNPVKESNKAKSLIKLSNLNKNKNFNQYPENLKHGIKNEIWRIYSIAWIIIGLFTFQWPIFLLMSAIYYLIVYPISLRFIDSIIFTVINWLNACIWILFAVFVLINNYYLRIDLYAILLSFLK